MNTVSFGEIVKLSDRELLARVQVLADRERGTMAALIAHLAVMDERRLYLGEGCSSLFSYCMRVLYFSESAAYRRVEAARIARRFPVILEMLTAGRINLTTIRLLAPELTPANHRNLLEAATHKSRLEVQKLIVGRRPQVPAASTVRQLPTRAASLVFPAANGTQAPQAWAGTAPAVPETSPTLVIRPPARPVVVLYRPGATKSSSRLRRKRTICCGEPRISCGTRFPAVTWVKWWRRHCDCWSNTLRRRRSLPPTIRAPAGHGP